MCRQYPAKGDAAGFGRILVPLGNDRQRVAVVRRPPARATLILTLTILSYYRYCHGRIPTSDGINGIYEDCL